MLNWVVGSVVALSGHFYRLVVKEKKSSSCHRRSSWAEKKAVLERGDRCTEIYTERIVSMSSLRSGGLTRHTL